MVKIRFDNRVSPTPDPPQYISSTSTDFQVTIFGQLAFSASFESEMSNEKFKVSQLEGKVTTVEGKVTTNTANITTITSNLAATNAALAITNSNLTLTNTAATALASVVLGQTISIGVLNGNQTTLSVPSFLSVSGSPTEAGAGDFVIGLGAGALPTSNGGTGNFVHSFHSTAKAASLHSPEIDAK